jgi:hypothetical protein
MNSVWQVSYTFAVIFVDFADYFLYILAIFFPILSYIFLNIFYTYSKYIPKMFIYFLSMFYSYSKCPIFLMSNEAHVAPLKSQKRLSGKYY